MALTVALTVASSVAKITVFPLTSVAREGIVLTSRCGTVESQATVSGASDGEDQGG